MDHRNSIAHIVSDVEDGHEVEQTQLHAAMKCRADDGCAYNPTEERAVGVRVVAAFHGRG